MARCKLNHLKRCLKIQEITQKVINKSKCDIKYSVIWRNIIYPIYFVSYASYIQIINMSNLKAQIQTIEERQSEKTKKNTRLAKPKFEDDFYFMI